VDTHSIDFGPFRPANVLGRYPTDEDVACMRRQSKCLVLVLSSARDGHHMQRLALGGERGDVRPAV